MCDCSRGPVSSMPGSRHKVPAGATCDSHPERTATFRIQGETDSFGCEYVDMCDECHQEYLVAKENNTNPGVCDLCDADVECRTKMRDPEEGSSGPVYDVCCPCRERLNLYAHKSEYPNLDSDDDCVVINTSHICIDTNN